MEWMYWLCSTVAPLYVLVVFALFVHDMGWQLWACAWTHCNSRLAFWFPLIVWGGRVLIPLGLLSMYRYVRTMRARQSEKPQVQVERDAIFDQFQTGDDVVTIFFPDVDQDEYSVCQYAGPVNLFEDTEDDDIDVLHLEAASIIAHPHIRDFHPGVETAQLFTFPEVTVYKPPNNRLSMYLISVWSYLTRAEIRRGLPRWVGSWSSTVSSYGRKDELTKGLHMVQAVMDTDHAQTPVVLFGVGRGAAVALKVAALLDTKRARRVKGVVLESCFASYRDLRLLKVDPNEDPVHVARFFPHKHMRFLLVTSKADGSAPWTKRLMNALKQNEVVCESVLLQHSRHGHYFQDDSFDVMTYESRALEWYQFLDQPIESENTPGS